MALYRRPNRPDLEPAKVPNDLEIAWSAGIYEGEGSCRLSGKTKRGFTAAVVQKDPELLYRLRELFGGSIGKVSKTGVRSWNVCGDYGRVFICLIYGYMTTRRKTQIAKTDALDFLEGMSPEGLSRSELLQILEAYYDKNFRQTWKGNPNIRKESSRKHYLQNSSNAEWLEKDRQKKREMRASLTHEQREEINRKAREAYFFKKQNSKISLVQQAS